MHICEQRNSMALNTDGLSQSTGTRFHHVLCSEPGLGSQKSHTSMGDAFYRQPTSVEAE